VTTLDEMTQQNAALAEETSAASASMSDNAGEMQRTMAFFKTSGSFAAAPTSRSHTAKPSNTSVQAKPAAPVAKPAPAPAPKPAARPAAKETHVAPIKKSSSSGGGDNSDEWEEF